MVERLQDAAGPMVDSESELRRDPVTGRWIIVNTSHPSHPKDYDIESSEIKGDTAKCPFCPNNEKMTPPEIYAERPGQAHPNTGG